VDIGPVNEAHALLGALAGLGPAVAETPVTTFGNDIDSVVDAILDAHRIGPDRPWGGLDRAQRLDLFRGLDEHGVFAVRRAVEQVAARLGISRASAYHYLSQARATAADGSAGAAAPPEPATGPTASPSTDPAPSTTPDGGRP
jgi:predicted transcriptional regulator YheO